jgi:hypothetical protein
MKRLHTYLTDAQHQELTDRAQESGQTVAELIREALDWYLSLTDYSQETMDMLLAVHPEMTPHQIVTWLMFRWRLSHEGKDYRNGDGSNQVIKMLEEVLTILRGTHDTDHG